MRLATSDFISQYTWLTIVNVLPVPAAMAISIRRVRSEMASSMASLASTWQSRSQG